MVQQNPNSPQKRIFWFCNPFYSCCLFSLIDWQRNQNQNTFISPTDDIPVSIHSLQVSCYYTLCTWPVAFRLRPLWHHLSDLCVWAQPYLALCNQWWVYLRGVNTPALSDGSNINLMSTWRSPLTAAFITHTWGKVSIKYRRTQQVVFML